MTIEEFYAAQLKAQQDLAVAQAETALVLKDISAGIKALLQTVADSAPATPKKARKAKKEFTEEQKAQVKAQAEADAKYCIDTPKAEEPEATVEEVKNAIVAGQCEMAESGLTPEQQQELRDEVSQKVVPDTVHNGEGLVEDCKPMKMAAEATVTEAKIAVTIDQLRELCAQLSAEQTPSAVFMVLSRFGERRLSSIPEEAWPDLKAALELAISTGAV